MKNILIPFFLFMAATGFGQQDSYWHAVPSGTTKRLLSISFGDAGTGYIGGADSLLLKTTNGGNTWQPVPLNGVLSSSVANDVADVDFISAHVGYITVTNQDNQLYLGTVYKTTDGGTSWTPVDAGNTAAYRSHFFSEGEGFVIGSAFFSGNVISGISAGQPSGYHYLSQDPNAFNFSLDFRNNSTGIVGGDKGQVYRTFDAGATWDTVQAAAADTPVYAIRFLNDSTILAATVGLLRISYDTGSTWQTDMNSLTFDYPVMKSMTLSAKDSFIAAGSGLTNPDQGLIYWHDHQFNRVESTGYPLHGVAMCNDSIAYAVGDSGSIVTNRTAPVLGIDDPDDAADALQLYPNPATGKFRTEMLQKHTVFVYNPEGRLVFKNDQPAFRHSINISAEAKGTYMVTVMIKGKKISRKITVL